MLGSRSRPGIGFVFAPPKRSILIQPLKVTRFASIPNWLCLAPFSVPGPLQRERPDSPVPSARCCCLRRSHPSSPRTRYPPRLRHQPSATLPAAPAGQTLSSIRVNGTHIRHLSGPPNPWAKLIVRIHRRCRAPNWVQHHPSGKSSTCYEMLRFPVFLKVWRAIF